MGDIKDKWYIFSKKTNTLLCGVDGYSLFQQSYNQSKKEPFYA